MPALNEKIQIFSEVETQDAYGTLAPTEVTLANTFAKVEPMTGNERDRARQTEARANYNVTIRRRSDLTEKHKIRWRSQVGNIRFIPDAGPKEELITLEVEFGAP